MLSAGSTRCEAAIKCKIPQVVSVGACDMVNFGPMDTIPEQFSSRNLYKHNPTVTLMRTTVPENQKIGAMLASMQKDSRLMEWKKEKHYSMQLKMESIMDM